MRCIKGNPLSIPEKLQEVLRKPSYHLRKTFKNPTITGGDWGPTSKNPSGEDPSRDKKDNISHDHRSITEGAFGKILLWEKSKSKNFLDQKSKSKKF
jgi:hypothetical protein